MAWTKTEYVHTITATGTTYDTTGIGSQTSTDSPLGEKLFQFELNGTSATIRVEVRNGNGTWVEAATVVLDSTTLTDNFSIYRGWDSYRFNTTAFTATDVKVYVTIG